ncbi:hypothetical protein FORC065_3015 [Yersinia enterocolitica]|nr:hypothetical protein FORC065_3015 [Yersinia enterocolitica]
MDLIGSYFGCYSFSDYFISAASTEQEGKPALLHLRLARNITAIRSPLRQPLALSRQRDGHPCPSALFAGVHARSLEPSPLSVIFLIALKVKIQFETRVLTLMFKSTFEPPSEECSKGNPPWMADLGVMSRDANKAVPPAE